MEKKITTAKTLECDFGPRLWVCRALTSRSKARWPWRRETSAAWKAAARIGWEARQGNIDFGREDDARGRGRQDWAEEGHPETARCPARRPSPGRAYSYRPSSSKTLSKTRLKIDGRLKVADLARQERRRSVPEGVGDSIRSHRQRREGTAGGQRLARYENQSAPEARHHRHHGHRQNHVHGNLLEVNTRSQVR